MRKLFYIFLFIIIFPSSIVYSADIVINSGSAKWIFNSDNGLLKGLYSCISSEKSLIFEPPCSLWELRNNGGNVNAETKSLTFSFSTDDKSYLFRWLNISTNTTDKNPTLEITLHIKPVENDTLEINSTLNTDNPIFDEIILPQINNVNMNPTTYLVVPYWMGEIYDGHTYPEKSTGFIGERGWEYPGTLSMQWIGLYNSSSFGICLWTQDTQQNLKSAHLYGDGKHGGMFWKHSLNNSDKFAFSYPVCLSAVHGDWYDMALLYRQWARNQSWSQNSRKKLSQIAPWVENTALWVWNRTTSEKVLLPAMDMAERVNLPVSVLWHWWHGCPYDIGFPEYLPPREGQDSFANALKNARRKNIHALIYVNQRLWGTTTRSWKEQNAERYAVVGKDGKIHPEIYNVFEPAPCVPMCIGTEFWHRTLLNIMIPTWKNSSVAGFYLDQACASLPCFATNHGHAPGEKDFWMKGFQQLTAQIREGCIPKDINDGEPVVLAGEGCGEAWLPYLDLFLSLQVSKSRYAGGDNWRPVPLFQAVYHPIAIQFGNYASLTEPPYDDLWQKEFAPLEPLRILDTKWNTQFRYEQACSFVWGQQPMIANYKKELWDERKDELEFVQKLATLRHHFPEYFLHGEMLRPLLETKPDTWEEICLSVYAYRKEGGKVFRRRGNLLVTMPWRSPDGKTALAVANADDEPRMLEFTIPTCEWSLSNEGIIIKHDTSTSTIIGSFSNGTLHFSHPIDKYTPLLFEFLPSDLTDLSDLSDRSSSITSILTQLTNRSCL